MLKKELELYELVLLFKFTTVEGATREKIDFYRDFIKDKGTQVMVKNNGKKSLTELEELVLVKGLSFGMDLSKYKLEKE